MLQDWLAHDDVQLAAYFPFFQAAGVQDVQVCLHDRCKLSLARCLMPTINHFLLEFKTYTQYLHPSITDTAYISGSSSHCWPFTG